MTERKVGRPRAVNYGNYALFFCALQAARSFRLKRKAPLNEITTRFSSSFEGLRDPRERRWFRALGRALNIRITNPHTCRRRVNAHLAELRKQDEASSAAEFRRAGIKSRYAPHPLDSAEGWFKYVASALAGVSLPMSPVELQYRAD